MKKYLLLTLTFLVIGFTYYIKPNFGNKVSDVATVTKAESNIITKKYKDESYYVTKNGLFLGFADDYSKTIIVEFDKIN